MKKIILFSILPTCFLFLLLTMLLLGGGGGAVMSPPATPEEAYEYQYIGSELGVPWEIVLLVDTFDALDKEKEIEEYNPLLTSLEFCILQEQSFNWIEAEDSENGDQSVKETEGKKEDANEKDGEWQFIETTSYIGKNEILSYLGYSENLQYQDISMLVSDANTKAMNKSTNDKKYEVYIVTNPDYEGILRNKLGFSEENISKIMELFNSHYLMYLYGYDSGIGDFVTELPPLIIGDVTREELAKTASSLIGLPYLFGGKSPDFGTPTNGLDCSGYVDWVYYQCFGKGISGGRIPDGISMAGTAMQFYASQEISESDLKIGDLGFYYHPAQLEPGKVNHVGIYIGKINDVDAFIHSGGSFFGYDKSPTGRVGISINKIGVVNSYNPITGGIFNPGMKGSAFKFFRRPNYQFKGEGNGD